MQNTFTIPAYNREKVEKAVARVQKKAAKYNTPLTVTFGDYYATEVPVYVCDGRVKQSLHETVKVEVFDLTIDSEVIRKGTYSVIASIEHLDGGNIVTVFDGEMNPAWIHMKGRCEHCNTNRARNKTFIVRGEDGTEKQVGKTCLMDYCGINPQSIGFNNELVPELLEYCVDRIDPGSIERARAFDTTKAIAFAMRVYRQHGYTRSDMTNSNKDRVFDLLEGNEDPTAEEMAEAREAEERIKAMPDDDALRFLLSGIRTLVITEYCKRSHIGFIAYAPVSLAKYDAELKRRADREAIHLAESASEYVGEVGKRAVFDIRIMTYVTSWETQYGTTHLYKFITADGNVLVWFASSMFGKWDENGRWILHENVTKIKATVKAHNERDGVKQTIITRCAVA